MARAFVPHIITDDTALVAGPYQIERSLRFDRNGTPGLYSEGFGSDGNRRKWTLSLWLKPNMPITDGANRSLFGLNNTGNNRCLLYTSPSPRDRQKARMPSSA